MSEKEFHVVADSTLDELLERLEVLENSAVEGNKGNNDVDITFASGVLTINLGRKGCWVINKQTPNRQLWWSSPLSGPRRYEAHRQQCKSSSNNSSGRSSNSNEYDIVWRHTKGTSLIDEDLRNELLATTSIDINA